MGATLLARMKIGRRLGHSSYIPNSVYLGNRMVNWMRKVQSGPGSGRTTLEYACRLPLKNWFPIRNTFPIPPPSGTVHLSPFFPSQFAVMIGELVRYQPSSKL